MKGGARASWTTRPERPQRLLGRSYFSAKASARPQAAGMTWKNVAISPFVLSWVLFACSSGHGEIEKRPDGGVVVAEGCTCRVEIGGAVRRADCGERFCVGATEYTCVSSTEVARTGERCNAGDDAGPSGLDADVDAESDSDSGRPAPECEPQDFFAPGVVCAETTVHCLNGAMSEDDAAACFESDPDCQTCFEDKYASCAIGTVANPGRCSDEYGCLIGCIVAECGADFTRACEADVTAGVCASQDRAFTRCYDSNSTANAACVAETNTTCAPTTIDSTTCPLNATPSSAVGYGIFTGSFFDQRNWIDGGDCGMDGQDAIYAWRAPASAEYEFSAGCHKRYSYDGSEYEGDGYGELNLLTGTCESASVLECVHEPRVISRYMNAGEEIMIAASCLLDVSGSDGSMDYEATFSINVTSCIPQCSGLECGDDGCGGSCGFCGTGERCASGVCECVPQCLGRTCGSDGCGGVCGTCGSGETCTSGRCQTVCVPSCTGRTCGSDGCGGSCGTCGGGQVCSAGSCGACVPSCSGRECGSNGCGGTCGSCGAGETCSPFGSCEWDDDCDPVTNTGCASPNECVLLSSEDTRCAVTGFGHQGSSCSTTSDCDGGYGCFAGSCRKICELSTDDGCSFGEVCNGVGGWRTHGACATAP